MSTQDSQLRVGRTCDVVVVGGGAAGIAAAIAAARSGADTLVVERYGFLGGMATTALVGAFCGLFTTGPQKIPVVAGITDELLSRLRAMDGATEKRTSTLDPRIASVGYDPELFKFVAERMALEAGVHLLFHTMVVDPLWEIPGTKLRGVVVENKSGRSAIHARVIIDASGDGDVAARAGVAFEYGDGLGGAQALTTIFRVTNVGAGAQDDECLRGLRSHLVAAKETGRYDFMRVDPVVFHALPRGTVSLNVTSIPGLDATDAEDLSAAEIEGRRQVFEYLRALHDLAPGFETARLSAIAPQVGVRESRRIVGDYVLTGEDVLQGAKFEDGITRGAWPVEIHNPETRRIDWHYIERDDDHYSIPLRCLLPRELDDLLVVGRCASTSHVAQASTRVVAQALGMGEAAGVAAALALDSDRRVRDVSANEVRARLEARGALV